MYSFTTLILIGAGALLLGAAIGALLGRQLTPETRKQRELERSLDSLLQQQKDYQHEVVEHFTDTAKLLNNLAESYRDVHNHLASGASALCKDDTGTILRPLPDSAMKELTRGEPGSDGARPPLDYAPKHSPYETGVLNEEFGLDKQAKDEDPRELIEGEAAPGKA